jgi:hypothetical protein
VAFPSKKQREVAHTREETQMSIYFCTSLLAVCFGALLCGVINVNAEHILTLSQFARHFPRRRSDRPVHPSTVHRWRAAGVHGVRLECVRIGGIWHTSLEAYARWVEQLTTIEMRGECGLPSLVARSQGDAVERQLDDIGL